MPVCDETKQEEGSYVCIWRDTIHHDATLCIINLINFNDCATVLAAIFVSFYCRDYCTWSVPNLTLLHNCQEHLATCSWCEAVVRETRSHVILYMIVYRKINLTSLKPSKYFSEYSIPLFPSYNSQNTRARLYDSNYGCISWYTFIFIIIIIITIIIIIIIIIITFLERNREEKSVWTE